MRTDRSPSRAKRFLLAGLLFAALGVGSASAQPGTVEDVRVLGLIRMRDEAFIIALDIEPGDPYDPALVRIRFRALWELKLFEDMTVESETGPRGGTVLVFKIKERPRVSSITYEENDVVTRTQIEDAYKEAGIKLHPGQPLDQGTVFKAEQAIVDLLGQRGFLDARVAADVREVTTTSRAIHFTIDPGGKTRIKKIEFTGNEVFKDRKLKGAFQLTEERRWYWPWSQKNLYHPIKWDQDVGAVRDLYRNAGYLDVDVRPPIVEVRSKKGDKQKGDKKKATLKRHAQEARDQADALRVELAAEREAAGDQSGPDTVPPTPKEAQQQAKKQAKQDKKRNKEIAKLEKRALKKERKARAKSGKRWVHLTAHVNEGSQYRLGEITIEGSEVFSQEILRGQFPIVEGAVVNEALLEFGKSRITSIYEDRGYLYANVVRTIERREGEEEPTADVRVRIDEDKQYYIGRIDFQGNTSTHERVLRRELLVREGDLFSRSRLNASMAKVNQLGYWQVASQPAIEPIPEENRVRVTVQGTEQGRNEIQVGGGYSGLDGVFFNGVYSTRNFLGRGQVLSLALQVGGRSNRYQISWQEPWFLGRPYLFGLSIFRRETEFGNDLNSTSSGFGVLLGKRLTRNSRLNIGYNFESVSSQSFSFDVDTGTLTTDIDVSSITPVWSFSTINNPYRPTQGASINLSMQIAGGPLGGDTSYLKPVFNLTKYRRMFGRTYLGIHAEAGWTARPTWRNRAGPARAAMPVRRGPDPWPESIAWRGP